MAELVDAPDLGSGVSRRVGSSPIRRTKMIAKWLMSSRLAFCFVPFGVALACFCALSGPV